MSKHWYLAIAIAIIAGAAILGINFTDVEPTARADNHKKAKLKGLLVTGGCCHDYKNQIKIITEGISQRASISWDVVHEGGSGRNHMVSIYKKADWAKGYDVVVHNECFGGVKDDKFVEGIVKAHEDGTPGLFIHCSMHSYRSAPKAKERWREMLGVTTSSHEKHRAVQVKTLESTHPIMKGFPAQWDTPNGELYKIDKVWPNCKPLAKAYGKDTKKDHTVIWTNTIGKGRMFGTTLGHHNETQNTEEWLGVVSRGLLWACDKLTKDGKPMAGYEGTGIKKIEIPAGKKKK
jgi:type 1 glutamine amidotransferase